MENKKNTSKEQETDMGEILTKAERFFESNQKIIYYSLIAILAIVIIWFLGKRYYFEPKNEEAAAKLVWCEQNLARDSFALALNGDGINSGYAEIYSSYKITKAKNEAAIGAAVCSFHLGKYDEAINYAKKANRKSLNFAPAMEGLIGDCYVEKGNIKEAISYFDKAAAYKNEALSPRFLKKAGDLYLFELKDSKKALEYYQNIKDKYFQSQEAAEIDKYIELASK
ncbi:hypothetical protein HW49_06630 [Porphyromonadaceae bacterium COT-184 OH4590]|nr:hypothetical protein HW49_06630 [Porphyromonadaceae bacterium COT-184 OH4590]MDO4726768.1 hypothetical protein [Porphyromonadaceae bacterium]